MTLEQFTAYLHARGIAFEQEGATISAAGSLYLDGLTTLPAGVTLSAGGRIYLGSLTTPPVGATISARGWLDLRSLTILPAGVTLIAGGSLFLSSLTALPEGVNLSAGDWLDLSSLTTLPAGATLRARGALFLSSLPALPEGVTLSAGRWLALGGLSDETQHYQGKTIRLRCIDGITTRLIRARKVGTATLWTAQYFRGHLDTDPRCYVAQEGDTYAHGETAERALRDLRFKIMSADFDPDELVARIKRRGTVEFNDYRLLTGACENGLREGLRARGLDPDTNELPLATALELSRGAYGGDRFARLMAGDA